MDGNEIQTNYGFLLKDENLQIFKDMSELAACEKVLK